MKYLSNFMALLLALTVNATMAQEVSVEEAQGRALNFLSRHTEGSKRAKGADVVPQVSLAYTSKSEGKTCFYVFNAGEDEGFVIIGGDEAAREILGYCDHGSFDYETAPDNFKWWLSQYTGQIAHAAKVGAKAPRKAKAETTTREQIDPMIKTKWNQRSPYNNLIPNYNDSVYVTGCVATAMAQVMYYHKHPATTGSGSYSYNGIFRYMSQDGKQVLESKDNIGPIDFGATTYMWDKMKLEYKTDPTDTDDAVATLMYHAGVSVNMEYGTSSAGGSGAQSEKICQALATYFGYDKAMHMERRDYYNDEDWENLVYTELAKGYPVFYSGKAPKVGHQFICDGYSKADEMFTFNWGWGGSCDGPYPLTGTDALLPRESGDGGAGVGSAYTDMQMIILGVKPNDNGIAVVHAGQISTVGGMYLLVGNQSYEDTFEYERSNGALSCYLCSSLFNISCLAEKLDFGVKAIKIKNADGSDVENELTYYYKDREINIPIGSFYSQIQKLKFDPSSWEEGTYELQPVCREYGQTDYDWQKVDILKDETYPTIVVKGSLPSTEGTIHFTERPSFNNDNNTYIGDLKMNFTIKNSTSNSTNVKIYCELTTETKRRSVSIPIQDVLSGQEREGSIDFASVFNDIDFEKEFKPNKKYTVKLFTDNNHTYYYNYPSVTFTYRATLNHGYGVSPAGYGTLILPFNAELPEGMSLYSCSLVDSEDNLLLSKLETDVIERNKPYIVKADPDKTYPFEGPEAIDETHLFNDGVLFGAVADDVNLIPYVDYIMQYNSETDIAAFYLYNMDENRKATPYRAFLRLEGSTAKYAPPVFPGDEPESIEEIRMNHSMPAGIYSLDGKRQSELKKGLNVIILEDGTTKKIYVK